MYTSDFTDGEAIKIAYNNSLDSIFHNCDADGNEFMFFMSIMYHSSIDKSIINIEGYITWKNQAPDQR